MGIYFIWWYFIGFIQTFFTISIAVLIFSNQLTHFLDVGISIMLIGYVVLSIIIALYSSLVASICSIQEAPAIILITIINSTILSQPVHDYNELFLVVIIIIIITTSITGLFFYLLGKFELGDLVRYMPYPVIAGFLAGTGWAMIKGGVILSLGQHEILSLNVLLDSYYIDKWLCGVLFGLSLFFILKHYKNILLIPIIITVTIAGFYLSITIQGISIPDIKNQGWLINLLSDGNEEKLALFNIFDINWLTIFKQIGINMPVMILVSIISLLLNVNAIEILTKQDIDLNKSLKVTGIANLIAGFFGSTVGYTAVDMTSLSYRMNIISRSLSLVSVSTTLIILIFFLPILNFCPNFIIGGFLIYIGLDFIYDWVYSVWFKLNKIEYAVVLLVMLIIIYSGFIEGVVIGVGVALLLFAANFSHVSIIKNSLSGSELQSNNQRGEIQQQLLIEQGQKIQLIILTGFIFFGTANRLCVQLKERASSEILPKLKYILLDWRQVTGMDSSTVYSLQKIQQLAFSQQIQLILTNVPENIRIILDNNLLSDFLYYFSDLNHGLDWCENEILASFKINDNFLTFAEILADSGISSHDAAIIMSFFQRAEISENQYLIREGDTADKLYFIESGCLDVFSESERGKRTYLQRISMGLFVGEIGLILKQPRTASIVTSKDSIVYEISLANLELMKQNAIQAYAEFERVMILLLAKRLFIADARVKRLL